MPRRGLLIDLALLRKGEPLLLTLTTGEEQEGTFDGLSPGVLWLRQAGYGVRRVGVDWITGVERLLVRGEA